MKTFLFSLEDSSYPVALRVLLEEILILGFRFTESWAVLRNACMMASYGDEEEAFESLSMIPRLWALSSMGFLSFLIRLEEEQMKYMEEEIG